MEYNFKEIEKKWQKFWVDNKTYKVDVDTSKPKFYVLDMFPYPSGAGLHVGHPLGYIASDIYSRYKRLKGFNVLHPMGYDAYGLPAEQYAIQTGQHPAITTDVNIKRYRQQLDKIGFSYDWDREIRTSDPEYYKWTQWAFIEMFKHYFDNKTQKAEAISDLVLEFQTKGNAKVDASTSQEDIFTAEEWNALSEKEQDGILLNYRLAYLANTMVNWCPKLGTVLANDEIKDGLSVRGGYPVEQKKMRQWSLRVSAYAKRLLEDMEKLEWTDSLKEIQRNWIGRSEGAEMDFVVKDSDVRMTVFTTRPDTIFGVSFMVLAPESELVDQLTTPEYKENIAAYIAATKKRTERERMADVKTVSGEFTGSYAIHPFSGEAIPVWVSDYVLAGYGTGAIMAVPAHDSRDYSFAKKFDLPIVPVVSGGDISEESYDAKSGEMINSDFMNGLDVKDAIVKANVEIEERELGKRKINFRLRDAIFSRQRYWGEPFPVYFKDGMPKMMDPDKLPLELPEVDKYLPTETGEPPLGRATNWTTEDGYPIELNTMPGFAGSSAYYLRYMDPRNNDALVSEEANEYWQDVDLYIGGTEHATGHLIYSRFWNKFLFDIGKVCKNEPFKKLINQGMIQGRSNFVYRVKSMSYPAGTNMPDIYVSKDMVDVAEKQPSLRTDEEEALYIYLSNEIELIRNKYNAHSINYESFSSLHVDVNIVKNDVLDTEAFKSWMPEFNNAEVILNSEGNYVCGWAVEKMSKSMFNVVNPDVIVEEYGADTLRLYEMFLGPLEASKPWDTNGIDGVHKFLKKLWRLFHNDKNEFVISTDEPTKAEYKILHKSIKKIQDDIERFSFNTSVSAFMICVNELNSAKCNKKAILEELLSLLAPFAPHITEELWKLCGNTNSITDAKFPVLNESYLVEDVYSYPVSFNGKMRFLLELSLSLSKDEIEQAVMTCEQAQKWIDGKTPKKVIIVPKKIVNIVV